MKRHLRKAFVSYYLFYGKRLLTHSNRREKGKRCVSLECDLDEMTKYFRGIRAKVGETLYLWLLFWVAKVSSHEIHVKTTTNYTKKQRSSPQITLRFLPVHISSVCTHKKQRRIPCILILLAGVLLSFHVCCLNYLSDACAIVFIYLACVFSPAAFFSSLLFVREW